MSLFGSSPPTDSPSITTSATPSRSLFDNKPAAKSTNPNSLFSDDAVDGSPWAMPTPRKQKSRADLVRTLLPASDVPDSYIEAYDTVLAKDGGRDGKIAAGGVASVFASAGIAPERQGKIMAIIAPAGGEIAVGRGEFNVLLALIGLAQEGESVSLDSVDERRKNLPNPRLAGLNSEPVMPLVSDLAAKPSQTPETPPGVTPVTPKPRAIGPVAPMEYPETETDPWNTPDMHKGHNHSVEPPTTNGLSSRIPSHPVSDFGASPSTTIAGQSISAYTATTSRPGAGQFPQGSQESAPVGGWGFFDGNNSAGTGFNEPQQNNPTSPFGAGGGGREPGPNRPNPPAPRIISSGRTGNSVEESVVVTLLPEKEGMFMFQHHNYEVTSARRGSKVIRRYSDFVWLLDCLHKRYPFRALPLLPPKGVAVNGNHLSNDGAFIEKRRRGLARFLNAIVRHPILSQEQLFVMFLTVPTELAVWRKQATISVQEEFAGRGLPPGLEDSLPSTLEELFDRTRSGVRRSAELYIGICHVMDRLVKRSEGVAADHSRLALSLASLTEVSAETYATDTNDVPLLNDGLVSMSKHLRTGQTLMEDESKAWDEGVLEDLKRQRDALVGVREMFERRDRLDKDNIPSLERRIQSNETKLAGLRAKPEGMVKPGEIEKVVEAIIKDKESIVNQHNRSVFVKECIRDELIYFQTTQYHVSRWNQDWAQERVKYAEMVADNWRRLLDELEGMPLGD